MKILIIGTGVIGSVYGWQLFESGNDITHFVRKGKKEIIEKQGINIRCLDKRSGEENYKEVVYKPKWAKKGQICFATLFIDVTHIIVKNYFFLNSLLSKIITPDVSSFAALFV